MSSQELTRVQFKLLADVVKNLLISSGVDPLEAGLLAGRIVEEQRLFIEAMIDTAKLDELENVKGMLDEWDNLERYIKKRLGEASL